MSAPDDSGEQEPSPSDERPQRAVSDPLLQALPVLVMALAGVFLLGILYRSSVAPDDQRAGLLAANELILAAPTAVLLGDTVPQVSEPGADPAASVPALGLPPTPRPAISTTFEGAYSTYGGERVLGQPIDPPQIVNGREIQWLERARLEHWPEHAGTPYEVQFGRLGVEFTQGREFARQSYFVSTPGLRYFPETGHALEGRFLAFWEQNGAIATFGLPISEAFDEVLSDGVAYRVQYFERARMEYHPELAGSSYEVQLGRLGAALLSNEARPNTVQPVPTAVPLP